MLYDWPHCAIIDGVLETTLDQLLLAFGRKKKQTVEMCAEYLHLWTWPRQFDNPKKILDVGHLKATASMLLSAAPVLAKFFRDIMRSTGEHTREIDCFVQACTLIEHFKDANKDVRMTPEKLEDEVIVFGRTYLSTFGEDGWVLKFHLLQHIPRQWKALCVKMKHFGSGAETQRRNKNT